MICRQCGREFADDMVSCPSCHAPVAHVNPWLAAFPTEDTSSQPLPSNPWAGYESEPDDRPLQPAEPAVTSPIAAGGWPDLAEPVAIDEPIASEPAGGHETSEPASQPGPGGQSADWSSPFSERLQSLFDKWGWDEEPPKPDDSIFRSTPAAEPAPEPDPWIGSFGAEPVAHADTAGPAWPHEAKPDADLGQRESEQSDHAGSIPDPASDESVLPDQAPDLADGYVPAPEDVAAVEPGETGPQPQVISVEPTSVLVSGVIDDENTPVAVARQSAERDQETLKRVLYIAAAMVVVIIVAAVIILW